MILITLTKIQIQQNIKDIYNLIIYYHINNRMNSNNNSKMFSLNEYLKTNYNNSNQIHKDQVQEMKVIAAKPLYQDID